MKLKYWNGEKWVGGGAAQQHKIKEDGGWDEHHRSFAKKVINEIVDYVIEEDKRDFSKPFIRRVR